MTTPATPEPVTSPDRRRRWRNRLLLACLAPLAGLAILETGLRLAGQGFPPDFLISSSGQDPSAWIPNQQFTWRFFGPERARLTGDFRLARPKAAETVRIFVMGESAALGDPTPQFGLARMLQALLELRYPDTRFEVVNAAITGINSHTIVPIARSCARAEGDIWVLYMGNNEVVGPFGAGTVFGPQAPPLPLIRASLALKSTRLGQELDRLHRHFIPVPADKQIWGGMLMFVDNQVPADDPRMKAVYHHFERNLSDILGAARRAGAKIVVSNVAVNLRDGGPFGTRHSDGVDDVQRTHWDSLIEQGEQALAAGNAVGALEAWQQAAAIDDAAAVLHYLIGHGHLRLGQIEPAREAFAKARDLDTLRFRCDSRLNDITRRVATDSNADAVAFVDAVKTFAAHSEHGTPGADFFYDHVHLNFQGNYLLATGIGQEVAAWLPEAVRDGVPVDEPWPSLDDCARRLAWTSHEAQQARIAILGRCREPPFTFQRDHERQVSRLKSEAMQGSSSTRAGADRETAEACRRGLALDPQDVFLHRRLAEALHKLNDLEGAEAAARKVTELLPESKGGWMRLGRILGARGAFDEAITAYQRADQIPPADGLAGYGLGSILAQMGRIDAAEEAYRRTIASNPHLGPAHLALGKLLQSAGRSAEAEACFRQALANRILRAGDLLELALVCQENGWYQDAAANLETAISLSPENPVLHLNAGRCMDAQGKPNQARAHYEQAVTLAPEMGQAHYLLGLSHGRSGNTAGALRHFERAARLLPGVAEAHLNLALAQAQSDQRQAAIQSLQEVLRIQPDHAEARRRRDELQQAVEP